MLAKRLIVAIIIIPVLVGLAYAGSWYLTIAMAAFLGFGAWEYWQLFKHGQYRPAGPLMILGVAGLVLARHAFSWQPNEALICFFLLAAMAWQVFQYEKGSGTAAVDFGITAGGILYLGWLGAYLISLRDLPDGFWWVFIVVAGIAFGDGGAYFVGSRFGKHKLSQRVSPNKSWEGYLGGVVIGTLGAAFLALIASLRVPLITADKGMILGLVINTLAPLGDLGESMLKRNFSVKDSSNVMPGHGGVMDRVDSWLWAAPIGFYLILLLWV
jgi:phosphatidate cytidylyltransferase